MKKLFSLWVLLLSLTLSFTGCQDEYDDTSIRKDIENIQGEIEAIKADLATLKGQVTSIQTLVDAHKGGKVVTQIEELPEGKGYRITFNNRSAKIHQPRTGKRFRNRSTGMGRSLLLDYHHRWKLSLSSK